MAMATSLHIITLHTHTYTPPQRHVSTGPHPILNSNSQRVFVTTLPALRFLGPQSNANQNNPFTVLPLLPYSQKTQKQKQNKRRHRQRAGGAR